MMKLEITKDAINAVARPILSKLPFTLSDVPVSSEHLVMVRKRGEGDKKKLSASVFQLTRDIEDTLGAHSFVQSPS